MVVVGFLAFVLALLISVTLHEAGHFVTARHYGMKATRFFVGFGPTLWSRRRGETEYGVKAIPAGGFVTIVGMTPLEEVAPGDEDRALWRRPVGQRLVVLSAGSFVHFLLAVLLVLLAALTIGRGTELSPGLRAVAPCVPATATASCDDAGALPPPAAAAGLQAGDVVVAVDGRPVDGARPFLEAVRAAPGRPVALTVERDGARRDLTVTPVPAERPSLTVEGQTETVGAIGVQLEIRRATERLGPVAAVAQTGETLKLMGTGLVTVFTEKLGTLAQVYGPERDPEGFVGLVGAGRISGEVLASDETLGFKVLGFLLLIASLNLFVGIFNLLPLLPLDGGHIAVALFEQARDRVRRLFGYRGELQRVDLMKLLPVTYTVVLLFAGFTLFLLGADIVNPVRLDN